MFCSPWLPEHYWAGSYRDCDYIVHNHNESNRICDEMDSVTLFECERSWVHPRSSQTKNFKISICCLSSKHVALRIKSKDLLVSGIMYLSGATCLPAVSMRSNYVCWSSAKWTSWHFIELFSPLYGWEIAHLVLKNNQLLIRFQTVVGCTRYKSMW